ncbi:hypothetical protein [Streptomyces sp. NPDC092307]|uniref:hypothetical protein n=1 Tax=Streptomyces sp. NPDC092307 TaxID=3366013 RepID=UPI00380898FF
MSELTVHVDGFSLYHGLHEKYGRRFPWIDLEKLARTLRPRDQLVKVEYFTASVMNDPAALSSQDIYLQALPAHSGDTVEIIKGRYQAKQKTCRQCGSQ